MTGESPIKLPRSRARKVGLIALWFVIGVFVLRAGLDWWTGRRLADEVTRLEARYGKIKPVSLDTVPERENRARAIRASVNLMSDAIDVINSKGRTELWRAKPVVPVPAELRALVVQNEVALRIAEDARQRPKSAWSYQQEPPLLAVRTLSNVLFLKACMALEDGHADEASRALATGLGVAASLRNEQRLIDQLVRIAIAHQQFVGVQRLLVEGEPSAAALEDLAGALEEERQPGPGRVALLGEMRWIHERWIALAEGDARVSVPTAFGWLGEGRNSLWFGLAAWFGRPAVQFVHARSLRQIDQLIDAQALPQPGRVLPSKTERQWWEKRVDIWLPGLERSLESFDEHAAAQSEAVVAIALRRYRLAHGAYPDDLAVLVPDLLKALPIDPYTQKPTAYRRVGKGFELKAGLPIIPNYEKRPFVWAVPK